MHGMFHAAFRPSWTPEIGLASQVLEAQNHEVVSPSDRSNLHPLVIPLAAQQSSQGQSEPMYTCLLRQVTLSNTNEQVCVISSFRIISHWTKSCNTYIFAGHACSPDVTWIMLFELSGTQHGRVSA